ncbi:hypothetical protein CAMGR0001_1485 [Campylobacter gracilis RM3268]|uniref:Uncharacterized protein n=1 Tax=Campylobacter gracilis RM3268 TaxID=553220 RepID=C8PJT5_9BACT|nr:hypothetical protein CAMGR0001_1485 [Campylobacter gracilis RM3268]
MPHFYEKGSKFYCLARCRTKCTQDEIYRRTSAQNFARLNLSLRKISTAHSKRLRCDKFKVRT